MSLLSLFGIAKTKPTPLTPAQQHLQFIDNTCHFFDLPWDGRKRLTEATANDIQDIKDIRAYSERSEGPSRCFWQQRVEHTALVMTKLHYSCEEIGAHKKAIRNKHAGTHFPPPR